jgi:hypothetical protein
MATPEPPQQPSQGPEPPGRRSTPPMHSTARLVRETDLMRRGIESDLLEVTGESLKLRASGQFAVNDSVNIHLVNPVQRCQKQTRGVVREIQQNPDGSFLLTVELFARITALEVSLFKMGIPPQDADSKPRWV